MHELEGKNVMAKEVQNQFSPALRMSYQKRAADDSKPTGAHINHIHKNRRISFYKNILGDFIQMSYEGLAFT